MKKILIITVTIIGILLYAQQSSAVGFVDGNELQQWAESNDRCQTDKSCYKDVQSAWLFGYVWGVFDAASDYICPPGILTRIQTVEIVKKYLKNHPENWHYQASGLVRLALEGAFPCQKK